jgi:hypothetical protein
MQAQRAELLPQIGRELVVAVDVGGARRDLLGREALHAVAQHVDGFAEPKAQAGYRVGHVADSCRKNWTDADCTALWKPMLVRSAPWKLVWRSSSASRLASAAA